MTGKLIACLFLYFAVVKQFQEYVEPDSTSSSRLTAPSAGTPGSTDESEPILPLGENVLINNLGIPIIIVITKVSYPTITGLVQQGLYSRHSAECDTPE